MDQHQLEQGSRLQQLIKALGLNQALFAERLGTTQPNISRMVSGESGISAKVLGGITKTYKYVDLHWLLTGEGVMFREAPERATAVYEPEAVYTPSGKGRLEDLEERLARLEEAVRRLEKQVGRMNK